jgi:hypothetical protein
MEETPMTIVIAWMDEEQVLVRAGRVDIGEMHKFKTVPKPMACIWVNRAKKGDLAKAEAYAKSEGKKVLTYEQERNPLEAAKRDMVKGAA